MPRGPMRFDPEEFSAQTRSLYQDSGIEPGYGHVVLNGRKLPALNHTVMFDTNGKSVWNSAWFRVPHGESGLMTEISINKTSGDPELGFHTHAYQPGYNGSWRHDWTGPIGDPVKGVYQGPEHLIEELAKHRSEVDNALNSGKAVASPNILKLSQHVINEHKKTDPSEFITGHWYQDLGPHAQTSAHGLFNPSRNFHFRRLR